MFKKPEAKPQFSELENKISKFWDENDVFNLSVENRKGNESWRFYDGPPFISGVPHFGHMKDFAVKDAVPRYWTMKGYYAPRIWGWDSHGLPIENKVEKKLGIKSKLEVEELGIEQYIEECYEYTRSTSAEWPWYIEKMGRWIDYDHAYRTMDQDYMETIWWVFKSLWEKGLIYKGWRSSLYSTDSATPVSNFEIAMDNTYEDVVDDAVTVKFKAIKDEKFDQIFGDIKAQIGETDVNFLSWTTTPWTLASNFALGVNGQEDYALVETSTDNSEITGVWKYDQIPFDYDKFKKDKIEEYVLSEDDELARKALKIGKKFYHSENGDLSEIDQKTFQGYMKEAKGDVLKYERIYYPLNPERAEGAKDISKSLVRQNLIANVDIILNEIEDEKRVSVAFNSPREYQAFKANLPDWFGEEITTDKYDESQDFKQYIVMALQLAENVLKGDFKVVKTVKGKELEGMHYEQIFDFYPTGKNDLTVYAEEAVTVEDGTGVLHVAPAFGEEDFEIGKKHDLSFLQCIDDAGNLLPETGEFAGMYLRDAALPIIKRLQKENKLYKAEKYTHRLPFYRYENPLIYRAQESWFVNIQKIKDQLFAENEKINWVPDHLKTGRFKKGIETAPDWSISRSRYWATTMPVWVLEDENNPGKPKDNATNEEMFIAGSRDDVRNNAIDPVTKIKFTQTPGKADFEVEASIEAEFNNIAKKIMEQVKNQKVSAADENTLKNEFADLINKSKELFEKVLSENEGQEKTFRTNQYHLAILKHLFEGKTLKESFASMHNNTSNYVMFFVGKTLMDLHRSVIDKVKLKHPSSGKSMVRVSDVMDSWLDSGSMPFAQLHYPFENEEAFKSDYPADFIVEYIAQTRAWFYVLHVLGVAMTGQNSFKNVVTTGVIAGNDGRKMSKTYGNYPDPKMTLETYGAEAVRWYYLTSKLFMGEDIKIDEKDIRDQLRLYLIPLWNVYQFFVTYADLKEWSPTQELITNSVKPDGKEQDTYWYNVPFKDGRKNHLDQWIIAVLQRTIHGVRTEMDQYFIPKATRQIQDFVEILSKSYIRRSRDRFNNGDKEAFETLYYVIVELTKLTAPFTPFIAEEIYQNLVKEQFSEEHISVHTTDYPEADMDYLEKNAELMLQVDTLQEVIDLGLSIRTQNNLKIRQPLAEIKVKMNTDSNQDKELKQWIKDLIAQELNVEKVSEVHKMTESEGWINQESENPNSDVAISLDTNITPDLEQKGLYRELVRFIQANRKQKGLKVGDEVSITIMTNSDKLIELVKAKGQELGNDVTAGTINYEPLDDAPDGTKISKLNGEDVVIVLK